MDLSAQIAQLLFVRIGSNMRPAVRVEDDVDRVEALLGALPIGGLVVFNGDAGSTPGVFARLQRAASEPLLVATDMERGLGQQLRGATVFPHAFAFDALGKESEAAIEQFAYASAAEALAAGIHVTFAPVADVHSNPDNPIISIRSFGSDPDVVAARVAAYLRGARRAGLLTTAKHFPGHGDTSTDSHMETPVVSRSRTELSETELPPFRSAIRERADLVMTAHVAYPALDGSGNVATRSGPILTDLLRTEMGFEGAVVTDSLLMAGAESEDPHWAAGMVAAGVDILLDVADPIRVHNELLASVKEGYLTAARIEEASGRIRALKSRLVDRFGEGLFADPSGAFRREVIGCDDHRRLARDIASRAITLFKRPDTAFPGPERTLESGLLFVHIRPHVTYSDPTAGSIRAPLERAFSRVEFCEIVPDTDPSTLEDLLERARTFGAVVVAAAVKPAAWHRFGLLPGQSRFVAEMIQRVPVVLVALGSPRLLTDFPDAAVAVCTWSDVQPSQEALVETLVRILGESPGGA